MIGLYGIITKLRKCLPY